MSEDYAKARQEAVDFTVPDPYASVPLVRQTEDAIGRTILREAEVEMTMANSRSKSLLLSSFGLLAVLLAWGGALRADEASTPTQSTFASGASSSYETLADTLIAKGADGLPGLHAQIAGATGKARAYAIWTTARLLRALGRSDADFLGTLEELSAGADDKDVRSLAAASIVVLGHRTPLGDGSECGHSISSRKLVAAMTDGNDHRIANNILVDQLLLHGQAALPAVLEAVRDPQFEGRGYAAWALAKIVRGTGSDPRIAVPDLEMAMQSKNSYVSTLAGSARNILRVGNALGRIAPRRRIPASASAVTRTAVLSPHTVSALEAAPLPTDTVEALVRAMPKRQGHWREIILDRLISKGPAAEGALRAAVEDETYGARAYAVWGLARLVRALGRPGSDIQVPLALAEQSTDKEARRYAASGRRILGQATPLGSGDEDGRALEVEALIGALVSGQVAPNNVLVDQLLLHGESAIAPLLGACDDDRNKAPFYTAWALAKVLRATGKRPKKAVEMFKTRYAADRSPRSILGF